jgi:hypothetical protein
LKARIARSVVQASLNASHSPDRLKFLKLFFPEL